MAPVLLIVRVEFMKFEKDQKGQRNFNQSRDLLLGIFLLSI